MQVTSNPQLWDDDDDNTATVINRTYTVLDTNDPLDLAPEPEAEEKPEEETSPVVDETPPEVQEEIATPKEEEGNKEEQNPEGEKTDEDVEHEKFLSSLNSTLERETGVPLNGIVEAITALLGWYNDILSLEQQQAPPQQPKPPNFQRGNAGATTPNPADRAYDIRHSEILRMSPEEYSQNAQRITNAFINKRVLFDV